MVLHPPPPKGCPSTARDVTRQAANQGVSRLRRCVAATLASVVLHCSTMVEYCLRLCLAELQLTLRQSSSKPRDWKSSWRDFSEVWEVSGRKFPEGGPDFLEVALVWKFPDGILPKQTSKKFASEPPKLLRSPSRSGSMVKLVLALS